MLDREEIEKLSLFVDLYDALAERHEAGYATQENVLKILRRYRSARDDAVRLVGKSE